jgi:anaerobic selenocysteine-containing dehydrogenase
MRRFQRAAEGHGDRQPPEHLRARLKHVMEPLPIWYEPFEQSLVDTDTYPIHALTQRPMAMYHSWGTQNAWLRQLHGSNPLYLPTKLWIKHGFQNGDWARVTSAHGEITVPVAHQAALNENTIWTWNAIGKRQGTWALSNDAPEAREGFLLNHLIHELLPARGDGLRWANSDPITGQAAWFDLRVRIEKTTTPNRSLPAYPPIASPVPPGPANLAWKVGK